MAPRTRPHGGRGRTSRGSRRSARLSSQEAPGGPSNGLSDPRESVPVPRPDWQRLGLLDPNDAADPSNHGHYFGTGHFPEGSNRPGAYGNAGHASFREQRNIDPQLERVDNNDNPGVVSSGHGNPHAGPDAPSIGTDFDDAHPFGPRSPPRPESPPHGPANQDEPTLLQLQREAYSRYDAMRQPHLNWEARTQPLPPLEAWEGHQMLPAIMNVAGAIQVDEVGVFDITTWRRIYAATVALNNPADVQEIEPAFQPRRPLLFPWIWNSAYHRIFYAGATGNGRQPPELPRQAGGHTFLVLASMGDDRTELRFYDSAPGVIPPAVWREIAVIIRRTLHLMRWDRDLGAAFDVQPDDYEVDFAEHVHVRVSQQEEGYNACGVHTILNAWCIAMNLLPNSHFRPDGLFYTMATQNINFTLREELDSHFIYCFLVGTGYAIPRPRMECPVFRRDFDELYEDDAALGAMLACLEAADPSRTAGPSQVSGSFGGPSAPRDNSARHNGKVSGKTAVGSASQPADSSHLRPPTVGRPSSGGSSKVFGVAGASHQNPNKRKHDRVAGQSQAGGSGRPENRAANRDTVETGYGFEDDKPAGRPPKRPMLQHSTSTRPAESIGASAAPSPQLPAPQPRPPRQPVSTPAVSMPAPRPGSAPAGAAGQPRRPRKPARQLAFQGMEPPPATRPNPNPSTQLPPPQANQNQVFATPSQQFQQHGGQPSHVETLERDFWNSESAIDGPAVWNPANAQLFQRQGPSGFMHPSALIPQQAGNLVHGPQPAPAFPGMQRPGHHHAGAHPRPAFHAPPQSGPAPQIQSGPDLTNPGELPRQETQQEWMDRIAQDLSQFNDQLP